MFNPPHMMYGDCNQLLVHNRYQRLKKIKKNLKNVLLDSVAQAARGMLLLDLGGSITNSSRFWSVGHAQEQTSLKRHFHSERSSAPHNSS